ncbi:hypothetical protein K2173_004858 [Erythroxylum novogranatense]|uniref:Uncharacterized protein n=1 Tax=Erythroxylum novogranatense TaxID=1862640 RepID=A0AAV8U8G6_9ROSI|nr:hypothetical protein K2173_004858 [Erythroxylum novogranatense]
MPLLFPYWTYRRKGKNPKTTGYRKSTKHKHNCVSEVSITPNVSQIRSQNKGFLLGGLLVRYVKLLESFGCYKCRGNGYDKSILSRIHVDWVLKKMLFISW